MNLRNLLLVGSVVAILAGCGSAPGSESTAQRQDELAAGCRTVCPKCPPNQICPLACYLECNGRADGGANTCVETQLCAIGYTWSRSACACVPSKH